MKLLLIEISFFVLFVSNADAQNRFLDKKTFFTDTSVLQATIITRLDRLLASHQKSGYDLPAIFITTMPDSILVHDPIVLELRGHFRKDFCYIPPVRIRFNSREGSAFHAFKSLKLVNQCKTAADFEQYLLKEYMVYRIYNQLTDLSYRVRLLKLTLQDSAGKKKTVTEYAFLMEDLKDVAKRDSCREWKKRVKTEETNRRQMTMVSLFEYMIGNTDWAVSANHNVRFMVPAKDSTAGIIVIPYDFDYSGLVNTFYAAPDERLNFQSVRERQYLGFPRNYEELEEGLKIFRAQKQNIYDLINHFDLLDPKNKREMTSYLDEFYDIIKHPEQVKSNFMKNAISQ